MLNESEITLLKIAVAAKINQHASADKGTVADSLFEEYKELFFKLTKLN